MTSRDTAAGGREAVVPPARQHDPEAPARGADAAVVADRVASLADPTVLRLPLPELLDRTLERAQQVFGAETATVLLADPSTGRFYPVASRGLADVTDEELRLPTDDGVLGAVLRTGHPMIGTPPSDDPASRPLGPGSAVSALDWSLLAVPLSAGEVMFGVMALSAPSAGVFTNRDLPFAALAATHVALALDHGLLLAEERTARDAAEVGAARLARLQRLTAALAGALTAEELIGTIIADGLPLLGARAGAVWGYAGGELRCAGETGFPPSARKRLRRVRLDAPYPIATAAARRRRVVLASIVERDRRYPALAGAESAGSAFAALPLVFGDDLLGVLAATFDDGAGLGDPANLEFLDAVAGQCALALHRVQVLANERAARAAQEAAVRRLDRLQAVTSRLSSASTATAVADVTLSAATEDLGARRCVLALVTEARDALVVTRAQGLDAETLGRFAQMPLTPGLPAVDAVLTGKMIVVDGESERDSRYPGLAGLPPHGRHTLVVLPLLVDDTAIGSLSLSFDEVRNFDRDDRAFLLAVAGQCAQALERSRLREGQRRSRRQQALLAETGRLFAASLDVAATLDQVCRLLVPALVDVAVARVFDDHGTLPVAAQSTLDPDLAEQLDRLWQLEDRDAAARLRPLVDAGEPVLTGPIVAPDGVDLDPGVVSDIEALDLRSTAVLPLRARGRSVGVVSVATRGTRPVLTEADLPFLHELSSRVALAVDNARLFRNQAEIAHTLQRSLLPAELPHVPGADLSVRYLPGTEGTTVGGDFFDVITLPSGRIGLVIGDVMGRGVRAAAVMGQLRAAVRSYALEGHGPAALLVRLDRLVTTLEDGLLVTCVYGEWDPQRATVRLSCAGHLPPLVRRPGAAPAYLEVDPGLPLGVGELRASDVEVELPTGSVFLAYTDGLVESPDLPLSDGMRLLAEAVGTAPGTAADVCRRVLTRLHAPARGAGRPDGAAPHHDDDVAMLTLVAGPPRGPRRGAAGRPAREHAELELPADVASPAKAREMVGGTLHDWGFSELVDTAVLLASELVTNAVRHAGTAMRLALRLPTPERVRVEVVDHAGGADVRPRHVRSSTEGGRGLFLVEALAAEWGSDPVPGGKVVWFELDTPPDTSAESADWAGQRPVTVEP